MSRRRAIAGAAATVAFLLALVPIGRWERQRSIDARLTGIQRVRAAIGPSLYGPNLSGFRIARPVDCLEYRAGSVIFARELCFDIDGRLIEAIDRRRATPKIWSVREEPSVARIDVAPIRLDRLIRQVGGLRGLPFTGVVPTAYESFGPTMRLLFSVVLLVGPDLRRAPLRGYRLEGHASCLEFSPTPRTFRYELCFASSGAVVSARDRQTHAREIAPASLSPVRANPAVVLQLLRKAGAPPLGRVTGIVPVAGA